MRRIASGLIGLGACALVSACGGENAAEIDLPEPLTEAEKAALVVSLPAPYNEADLENGASKFTGNCKSCHTVAVDGKNLTGPNLFGIFGRQAAARPDFEYSDVLKESGIVWNASHVDGWLAGPRTYLKGTKMSFAGLRDETDRRDLIVYLMTETGYRPTPAPATP